MTHKRPYYALPCSDCQDKDDKVKIQTYINDGHTKDCAIDQALFGDPCACHKKEK